ncbi:chemotaxis response regulator protein-glutamate methylesterase [Dongia mobilis]|uniref:protein-glutamate methylesterase/protein-glutamine glutaminase n=1 Tax=Dongia sp. TaxID=1977262 RepID=UPI0026F21F47
MTPFKAAAVSTSGGKAGPYRVMVVDDSAVIRGLLTRALESDPTIKVVTTVGNGQLAIDALGRPDNDIEVIVLDIEMPVMDGITALPRLLQTKPGVAVIMASTLTLKGASVSMKAMSLGSSDYVPKPTTTGAISAATDFKADLVEKVKSWAQAGRRKRGIAAPSATGEPGSATPTAPKQLYGGQPIKLRDMPPLLRPECLAIGSSTGGPQALFKVFQAIGKITHVPVFVTQHMPATFTTILAEHLGQAAGMPSAEAKDGEPVVAGRIYVAPGDFHMVVEGNAAQRVVRINKNPPENFCRPAVDPMLRSIAKVYGNKTLFVMLTGMGQDGLKGATELTNVGGTVIAQDEPSSVVWGMPGAVATAGLCSAVLPLADIGAFVKKAITRSVA